MDTLENCMKILDDKRSFAFRFSFSIFPSNSLISIRLSCNSYCIQIRMDSVECKRNKLQFNVLYYLRKCTENREHKYILLLNYVNMKYKSGEGMV